jgi:hypothetical protein
LLESIDDLSFGNFGFDGMRGGRGGHHRGGPGFFDGTGTAPATPNTGTGVGA